MHATGDGPSRTLTAAAPHNNKRPVRIGLRRVAALLLLFVVILTPFIVWAEQVERITALMLAGAHEQPAAIAALIIALLASDIALPIPSSLVSLFAGAAFGWTKGAFIIWMGMNVGAVIGYVLGASAGRALALRIVGGADMARARAMATRIGPAALILARGVPVLAEASVLAAGAARMPLGRFLLATLTANAAVAAAYAYVGGFASASDSFLTVFACLAVVPALAWTLWRLVSSRVRRL